MWIKLRRLLDNKAGSGVGTDVSRLIGGTALAQVITLLAAPVLTRVYSPAAFGTAGIFNSLVTILAVVACLRYEFAIMLPDSDAEAANVLGISVVASLVVTAVSFAVALTSGTRIAALLNAPALAAYLWLLPWTLLATGLFQALNYWNSRKRHFARLAATRVAASTTTFVSQSVGSIVSGGSAGGLVVGSTLGSTVATLVLGSHIWRDNGDLLRKSIRWRRLWLSAVRFRKFPLLDSWGGLINNLAWQLPVLLFSVYFTQAVVGYYSLAYRIIQVPMAVIGVAIGQVFFQRASSVRGSPESLANIVLSTFEKLVALTLVPAILLTLVGQDIFTVFMGQRWSEAGRYVQLLGPWTFVWFVSSPLHSLFAVQESQGRALVMHVAILISRLAALVVGGSYQSVTLALILFSTSGILVYGITLLWIMKLSGVARAAPFRVLLRYGGYGLALACGVIGVKVLFDRRSLLVLLCSCVLAIVYYLWVFRRPIREYWRMRGRAVNAAGN